MHPFKEYLRFWVNINSNRYYLNSNCVQDCYTFSNKKLNKDLNLIIANSKEQSAVTWRRKISSVSHLVNPRISHISSTWNPPLVFSGCAASWSCLFSEMWTWRFYAWYRFETSDISVNTIDKGCVNDKYILVQSGCQVR